jgi:hypothetical protein
MREGAGRGEDLGRDVVDVGEAHADEAAEALDLRRHVRRRHPRLHHLRCRSLPSSRGFRPSSPASRGRGRLWLRTPDLT